MRALTVNPRLCAARPDTGVCPQVKWIFYVSEGLTETENLVPRRGLLPDAEQNKERYRQIKDKDKKACALKYARNIYMLY